MYPRLQTAVAVVALTLSGKFAGVALASPAAAATSGQIVTCTLGKQPSLQAAAGAMLSRVHQSFGARPTVEEVAQDDLAAALVQGDPLYKIVRPSEPIKGVDY